jgi:enoyl-CoA hydratase/carnithine racemase
MSETPAEGRITCEVRGPLLLIGIDRPAKYNGFTPRMFRELGEAHSRLDDDADLRGAGLADDRTLHAARREVDQAG